MSFLQDLASAHRDREGWYPGSLSQRNNNPGNLRLQPYQAALYGAVQGEGGFARFPTPEVGFRALMDDLRAKITGHSTHIDYEKIPKPTLQDYVNVFAPAEDHNDPTSYAQFLVKRLSKYNVRLDTPLSVLASLVNGDIAAVPQEPGSTPPMPPPPGPVRDRWLARLRAVLSPSTYARLIKRLTNSPPAP